MLVLGLKVHGGATIEVPVEVMKEAIENDQPIRVRVSISRIDKKSAAHIGFEARRDIPIRRDKFESGRVATSSTECGLKE